MSATIPNIEASASKQTPQIPVAATRTLGATQALVDSILEAIPAPAALANGKRTHASDPLLGHEPDPNVFAAGLIALTPNRAFTLFDALKSVSKLFAAEGAMTEGTMNLLSAASTIMDQLQTKVLQYQTTVKEINKVIKEEEPPHWLSIMQDIFMVVGTALAAFVFAGPVAAVAAVAIAGTMTFLSQAPIMHQDGHKVSCFQKWIGNLPEGEQIGIKVGIAALLACLGAGAAMAPVGVDLADEVAEVAAEADDVPDERAPVEEGAQEDRFTYAQNRGYRAIANWVTTFTTSGEQIQTSLKGKKGEPGPTFGMWGDVIKAAGGSDTLARVLGSTVIPLLITVGCGAAVGGKLGMVPSSSAAMDGALQKALMVVSLTDSLAGAYSGYKNIEVAAATKHLANARYILDRLDGEATEMQFVQVSGEGMTGRAVKSGEDTMNTVWQILQSISTAAGVNQAV